MDKFDLSELYRVVNKKEKSVKDFMEFLDFMYENKNKVKDLPSDDKRNFNYHFNKVPLYTKEMLLNLRSKIVDETGGIDIRINRIHDALDLGIERKERVK